MRPAILQELLKASGSLVVLALETWAEEADEAGLNKHPLEILSEAHEHGWYGLTADPGKARAWAQRGAERGITSCERKAAAYYLDELVGKEDLARAEDYARRAAQKGDGAAVALWAEVRRRRSGNPAEIAQILRDGLAKCSEGPDRSKVGGLLADLDEAWPPTHPQWRERIVLWSRALEHRQLSANQTKRLMKNILSALRLPDQGGIKIRDLLDVMKSLCEATKEADLGAEVNAAATELETALSTSAKALDRKEFISIGIVVILLFGLLAAVSLTRW
jgi:TPR repeat protein